MCSTPAPQRDEARRRSLAVDTGEAAAATPETSSDAWRPRGVDPLELGHVEPQRERMGARHRA